MKVRRVMNPKPRYCAPSDSLASVAQIMRDHDCGFLPVIGDGERMVGVITDRDICLSAELRSRALDDIAVEGTMHTDVQSCREDAKIADVLGAM